jgi:hypothetical protein
MSTIEQKFSFGAEGGQFNGVEAPFPIAGVAARYLPHWAVHNKNADLTTTAGRLYYVPYFFPKIISYTGLAFYNGGAGDNAEVWRAGVYQASNSTGLPSALIQDCGEGTLTAASAERLLATAFTPAYIGWHYIAFHANSASNFKAISNISSASTDAGMIQACPGSHLFGKTSLITDSISNSFGAYYVDTAYGALASTAVAPTAITTLGPLVAPYRT